MDDKDQSDAFSQMAAYLNGHQVTDQEGQVQEGEGQTPHTEPAAEEPKTPVKDDAPEKKAPASQPVADDTEDDLVEVASDDTGKRYVPESRFKKVYGKLKEFERKEAERSKQPAPQPNAVLREFEDATKTMGQPPDKAEQLEVEMLKNTLPQFDRESDQYDGELDALGVQIYQANPGITRIEAARRAIKTANALTKRVADVQAAARTVKSSQSDQGITSRVVTRDSGTPDPATMSLQEMEEWLRANGQW